MSSHNREASVKPKVLILTGPTGVGKTKASLALAERLNGEIISADSVQVYRGLDIGSDKIGMLERRGVPHHLLDILEPTSDFSAGDFFLLARQATADILSRGRTPIVVGGTGLYLRWYVLGKPSTPASTPNSEAKALSTLQQAWEEAVAARGGPELSEAEKWEAGAALVEKLGDTESASRLRTEPNNYYRLQRVVDILLQSGGKPLAALNLDEAAPPDYDFRAFFLHRPRAELYSRIDQRVEQMMMGGLMQEAQMLLDLGLHPNTNCASRAIGYRQALEYLQACHAQQQAATASGDGGAQGQALVQGGQQALSEERLVQLVRDIQAASRKLCHRQMVWFRDDQLFKWVDATAGEDAVLRQILEEWERPQHEGGCGTSGRLTKEEERAMRQYRPKLELFAQPGLPAVLQVLEEVRGMVAQRAAQQAKQLSDAGGTTQRAPEAEADLTPAEDGKEQRLKRQRHA